MRVLITGGGGFIGSHLVRRMLDLGHEVVVIDNFATGRRENLADVQDDVRLVEGDIRSYERVHSAVAGCEAVFHQAALPSVPRSVQDPLTSTAVNVTGTLNVLLNARDAGVRRVVFASSSSIYGKDPTLPKQESVVPQPLSPYAVSKLAGEGLCRSFGEVYGLECVALRYFNVFGPRQDPQSEYAAVVPRFITALLTGTRPTVYGDGEQSRDFTFIDNVVLANEKALSAPGAGGVACNVAAGARTTLNELLQRLAAITGATVEAEHQEGRAGDVRHSWADLGVAEERLGFRPEVQLDEGLRRTVDHYAERLQVSSAVPG